MICQCQKWIAPTVKRRFRVSLFALNRSSVCESTSGLCARSRAAYWALLTHFPVAFGSATHNRPHRVSKAVVFKYL
jgi:hypothetical protein